MTEKTYVYLMKDLRNSFHKIGYSNNPTYREKTLQSEQPLIELVEAWEADKSDEKELHNQYKEVRVRGEWFNLSAEDIDSIRGYFYDNIQFSTGKSADTLYLESRIQYLEKRVIQLEKENRSLLLRVDELIVDDFTAGVDKPSPGLNKLLEPLNERIYQHRRKLLEDSKMERLPSLPKRF